MRQSPKLERLRQEADTIKQKNLTAIVAQGLREGVIVYSQGREFSIKSIDPNGDLILETTVKPRRGRTKPLFGRNPTPTRAFNVTIEKPQLPERKEPKGRHD